MGRYPVRHDYTCWDGQMVEAEKEKKMKELEKKQKALERHAISARYTALYRTLRCPLDPVP